MATAAHKFKNDKRTKHESLIQQIAVSNKKHNAKYAFAGELLSGVAEAMGFFKQTEPFSIPMNLIGKGISWVVKKAENPEDISIVVHRDL